MPGDVDAALSFLASQGTVNNRALGVVGGSCGVNQAVHAARRHAAIRTLVLLSGATDAAGEAYVKESPKLPILGMAIQSAARRLWSSAGDKVIVASLHQGVTDTFTIAVVQQHTSPPPPSPE